MILIVSRTTTELGRALEVMGQHVTHHIPCWNLEFLVWHILQLKPRLAVIPIPMINCTEEVVGHLLCAGIDTVTVGDGESGWRISTDYPIPPYWQVSSFENPNPVAQAIDQYLNTGGYDGHLQLLQHLLEQSGQERDSAIAVADQSVAEARLRLEVARSRWACWQSEAKVAHTAAEAVKDRICQNRQPHAV